MESSYNTGTSRQRSALAQKPAKTKAGERQQPMRIIANQAYRIAYYTGIHLIRRFKKHKKQLVRTFTRLRLSTQLWAKKKLTLLKRRMGFALNDSLRPLRQIDKLAKSKSQRIEHAKTLGGAAVLKERFRVAKEVFRLNLKTIGAVFNYAAPVISLFILIQVVSQGTAQQFALAVEYNGEVIGYIEKEAQFDDSEKIMQNRIVYEEYQPPIDTVPKYTLQLVDSEQLSSTYEIADKLIAASGNEIAQATGIYVDGKFHGAVKDATAVRSLLNGILDQYRTENENERVSFVQDVQLTDGFFLLSSIIENDEMQSILTGEVAGEVLYIVEAGDAPSLIAQKHDMPYAELKALNPEIESKLLVGQEVLISNQVNFLTVKRTVTETYEQQVPFGTQEEVNANYAKGYRAVKKSGVLGSRMVTADVVYVNGMEQERTEIESVVLKEPQDQVVTVGTAAPIQVLSTGSSVSGSSFIWPVDGGKVTCHINGYWGHTGMDIGASRGTIVRAAASGTVTKAVRGGYNYGYGTYVRINHGNGVETLYAHMSDIAVSYGTTVQQGQIIGYVGMTGNASGNHCHFEIIIGGRFMDPAKYIGSYYPGR